MVSGVPAPQSSALSRMRPASTRTTWARRASGTSSSTAEVTMTCSKPPASSARRVRRPASSSAKTSSRMRTGSPKRDSARRSSAEANRRASATDQDSPCDAYPLTGGRAPRARGRRGAVRRGSAPARALRSAGRRGRRGTGPRAGRPALLPPRRHPLRGRRRPPTAPTTSGAVVVAGDRGVRAGDRGREIGCQGEARLDHFGAEGHQLLVPDVEVLSASPRTPRARADFSRALRWRSTRS